ncbi:MAG: oxygen-dependent coproporphyrinogen oxidase [Bacteroidia bacterium]|jgi:coproporphyrinogen III oxidase|nr:oxygen-dependent coproporphyrinogen oxidase [Bacteroidia bacterium]
MTLLTRERIAERLQQLQADICKAIETTDGAATFSAENWERDGGGGGITRIIQHGRIIEKGGVNFSAVHGELPENIQRALKVEDNRFFATGVSIVQHPVNPNVPIIHMNVRYFELGNGQWWFGGGIDLTPHYVDEEDARWFHARLKAVCDKYDATWYPRFKTWADDYFFITHRNETRGIGGIFFDRLSGNEQEKERLFNFLIDVGEAFAPVYTRFMQKHADEPYGEAEKKWQLLRRGRYVEFNLVYDKGTRFGLDTGGRIESILMSLPEQAGWFYDHKPETGSREELTARYLVKGLRWD